MRFASFETPAATSDSGRGHASKLASEVFLFLLHNTYNTSAKVKHETQQVNEQLGYLEYA